MTLAKRAFPMGTPARGREERAITTVIEPGFREIARQRLAPEMAAVEATSRRSAGATGFEPCQESSFSTRTISCAGSSRNG